MILSHRHRLVFIKGRKIGGTSLEIALESFCGPRDIVTPITQIDELARVDRGGGPRNYARYWWQEARYLRRLRRSSPSAASAVKIPAQRFYNHMSLAEVEEKAKVGADYRIFFIERSPYAKILSFANMKRDFAAYAAGGSLSREPSDLGRAVDRCIEDGTIGLVRNIDLYRNAKGEIVGEAWRFHALDEHWRSLCEELNVDWAPLPHAKQGITAESLDPRDWLRADQIAIINEMMADEFMAFGYPMLA
jgi:hypothetical protein